MNGVEASRLKGGGSPYNKRIELTALGRHGLCLRKARAGDAPGLDFPVEALRPCSQLIRALYGPNEVKCGIKVKKEECERISSSKNTYDANRQAWHIHQGLIEIRARPKEKLESVPEPSLKFF